MLPTRNDINTSNYNSRLFRFKIVDLKLVIESITRCQQLLFDRPALFMFKKRFSIFSRYNNAAAK